MFKFIDSSDNVIALRLTNTITGDDLNAIMDRVDDMMAKQDKIHVYVETHHRSPPTLCFAPPKNPPRGDGVNFVSFRARKSASCRTGA